jgi:ribonuclease P protein component
VVAHRSTRAQHLLRNNADIRLVFKEGRRASSRFFTLLYRVTALDRARVGTVVGKKLGGATQRNRCKRRFRELARMSVGRIAAGWDLLVLPKREAVGVAAPTLRKVWMETLARAGLLPRNGVP